MVFRVCSKRDAPKRCNYIFTFVLHAISFVFTLALTVVNDVNCRNRQLPYRKG